MWAERSERSERSERYAEYAEPRDVKRGLGRALDFGEPGEPDYFLANSQSLMGSRTRIIMTKIRHRRSMCFLGQAMAKASNRRR